MEDHDTLPPSSVDRDTLKDIDPAATVATANDEADAFDPGGRVATLPPPLAS